MMQKIAEFRMTSHNDPLWKQMPPLYKKLLFLMLSGGVKVSSHGSYVKGFLEFWRTMRRLGIPDSMVWTFPVRDALLQVYIINCALVRAKPNVYGTIRAKLRGIDYVVQLTGKHQNWSKNPALSTMIDYCKKRNPNKGSDTLPISGSMMLQLVGHIMIQKVFAGLKLTAEQSAQALKWFSFDLIWHNKQRMWWYVFALSILVLGCLGLRGAELYENDDKKLYDGYGLYLSDVDVMARNPYTNRIYECDNTFTNPDDIYYASFRLRNSKTGTVGNDEFLAMGRTHKRIDPVLLVHHLITVQKKVIRPKGDKVFLFSLPKMNLKLRNVKKKLKKVIVDEMQYMEGEKYRLHGTRKGFATTLQRAGLPMSLIAFAGRWKLEAAIYQYLIHSQKDLLCIVSKYLYGVQVNNDQHDWDESEINIVQQMRKGQLELQPDMFHNTENLGHREL